MERYKLPDLPWDPGALEPHYSGHLVELHHSKHHAAYVTGANETLEKLSQARDREEFDAIAGLERDLAFHVSGHVLHSLFWRNLSPNDGRDDGGGGEAHGVLADAIERDFGSFDALERHMTHAAMALQGSGWAALCFEPVAKILTVQQFHDHRANAIQGSLPLLVLDMWEHAYYLQYEADKGDWVEAFWNIVDWADVGARFDSVRDLDPCVAHAPALLFSKRSR